MRNLYAVLVAINEYPIPAHRLRGCINDRDLFKEVLEEKYGANYQLHLKTLTDKEATRNGIIECFDWFLTAKDKDLCLFFYAGHGAQILAPSVFHHLESDNYLESVVCYDSRLARGRDLVDKELSYLIWKTCEGKDIHFVAIMDCCHSGTITRKEEESHILTRKIDAREDDITKKDFLGYEYYKVDEKGNWTPPRARHILLSAAQASETAKEVRANGEARGVFTFSLLEALQKTNQPLSYTDLMEQTTARIQALVRKQTPRLDADIPSDKRLAFLSHEDLSGSTYFYIHYNYDKKDWIVNAGAIHGLRSVRDQSQITLKLEEENTKLDIKNIYAGYSTVDGMNGMPKKVWYKAILINELAPIVNYHFSPGTDSAGKAMLIGVYDQYQPELFTLKQRGSNTDYVIHINSEQGYLSSPSSEQPLFEPVNISTEDGVIDFLKRLSAVAKWLEVKNLKGPEHTIAQGEFLIEAELITEIGNYTYDAQGEVIDLRNPIINMNYNFLNGVGHRPAFRMKIKNIGNRKLWCSALYLGSSFGISNVLLPGVAIMPGEEQWLEDRMGNYPTNAIQLWIPDNHAVKEEITIKEYLKIFISKDPLRTDDLNQDDLPPYGEMDHRGFGNRSDITLPGWTTREFELVIHRPQTSNDV